MIPAKKRVFAPNVRNSSRADFAFMNDFSEEKWPVWLRLVIIIGLSTGLWATILWTAAALFR
jgi:hypothetical protein